MERVSGQSCSWGGPGYSRYNENVHVVFQEVQLDSVTDAARTVNRDDVGHGDGRSVRRSAGTTISINERVGGVDRSQDTTEGEQPSRGSQVVTASSSLRFPQK